MTVVIDDHLLRGVLTGKPHRGLRKPLAGGEVWTTGLWYHRLCAALAQPRAAGKLSVPVSELPESSRRRFRERLVALPDEIGLLSLREIAWRMGELKALHRLSTLGAEAVAAAQLVEGDLLVSADDVGAGMQAAAKAVGVRFRSLS